MNNLYDALEICLQEIEQGADTETVLRRYPKFADQLRPILETSAKARELSAPAPSPEVLTRNRAKVLRHAAQMREANAMPPSRRIWFAPLRRMAVALVVLATLFVSGTGLVRAASTTLPGDNLYPVKRTWEDVKLLFTFNLQEREALEIEHENERLEELREVFAEGRSTKVDFVGLVTRQNRNDWLVAGFPVMISSQTDLPDQQVQIGDAVRVRGFTQSGGAVLAEGVDLLPPGAILPEIGDDSVNVEEENNQEQGQQGEEDSGTESGNETLEEEASKTPAPEVNVREESFEGFVDSMNGNLWVINGLPMDVSSAEIKGSPSVGVIVKVEGYFNSNGMFIVTKIEFIENGSNSGSSGSDDNGSGSENGNINENGNENENGNGDDGGGGNGNEDNSNDGGGNSGSGGGSDD